MLRYPVASTPLSDEVARLLVEQYGPGADPQLMVSLQGEEVDSLIAAVERSQAVYLGILAAALQAGDYQAAAHLAPLAKLAQENLSNVIAKDKALAAAGTPPSQKKLLHDAAAFMQRNCDLKLNTGLLSSDIFSNIKHHIVHVNI